MLKELKKGMHYGFLSESFSAFKTTAYYYIRVARDLPSVVVTDFY